MSSYRLVTQRTGRIGRRLALLIAVTVAVVAATSGIAFAYWLSSGSGTGSATTGTLNPPSAVGVPTASTGTVSVTWTASAGSPAPTGYYVTRILTSDSSTANACGTTPTSTITGTSCTDTSVPPGTYTYQVTAIYHSWTATSASSGSVTVSSAAATNLLLTAASTTPTAGAADNLTITARDASGNTVTGYSGDKSLTFGGASTIGAFIPTVSNKTGTPTSFGTAETITFTGGVASVSGANNGVMKLYKAGTASITVTDGTINNSTGLSVTVSPAAAANLLLSAASTTPTAGVGDNLTITARDTFGNTVTGYSGDKSLTFGGAATIGASVPTVSNKTGTPTNFGTAETITFTGGVASVSGANNGVMTLYKAETASITVTDGTINNSTGLSVTVSAAAASVMQLSQCLINNSPVNCSAPIAVGNNGTLKANIDVFDAFGNVPPATSVAITFTNTNAARFTITPASGVSVTGTGSPTNRSAQFTVTLSGTSSASTMIHAQATGFSDLVFTVAK